MNGFPGIPFSGKKYLLAFLENAKYTKFLSTFLVRHFQDTFIYSETEREKVQPFIFSVYFWSTLKYWQFKKQLSVSLKLFMNPCLEWA